MWLVPRLFLCLAALAAPCAARITKTSIVDDSRNSITLSRPFEFTFQKAFLQFNVTNAAVRWTDDDHAQEYDCFRFYLASPVYDTLDAEPEGKCWQENDTAGFHVFSLATFSDFKEKTETDGGHVAWEPFGYHTEDPRVLAGASHTMYFVNCCPASVTFDIVIDMYNTINGQKTYLSLGEIELPTLYLIMCLLFTIGLGIWSYTVYSNKSSAHRIHYLMIVLGVFKVLTLLAQGSMYHYLRVTGHPDGWNVAYYIFTFFRSIFLFSIIVLIGTGWSYMTPFLGDNEKRVLMVVLPFQVLVDVAIVVIDEFTPAAPSWFTWRDVMHFLDIICCCAVLFPIAWRIRYLHEASATDGKAERSMQQLIMFRHFYIMVVVYIYFTRIVVYLLRAALPPDMVWLAPAAEELATLTFYTLTAAQFRPHQSNSYTKLVTEAEIEMSSV